MTLEEISYVTSVRKERILHYLAHGRIQGATFTDGQWNAPATAVVDWFERHIAPIDEEATSTPEWVKACIEKFDFQ
jgi:hypothetical protein